MKHRVKSMMGRVLVVLLPGRAAAIAREGFTLPSAAGQESVIDRLIRLGLAERARAAGDHRALARYHEDFWRGPEGTRYHEYRSGRFEAYFREALRPDFDALAAVLAQRPDCLTLCEIGTGEGAALRFLAERFPQLERLTGLDLSPEVIRRNETAPHSPRLSFACGEALAWMKTNGQTGWCVFAVGGVLEYLTQPALAELLGRFAGAMRPTVLLIAEPIDAAYDLTRETASRPYGGESSFTHNYPRMLREAGFEIWHQREATIDGARMLIVGASAA